MRHRIFYAGRAFALDSEIPHTHALLGQRAEHLDRPAAEILVKKHSERTPEEAALMAQYVFRQTHGWYAMRVLGWAETEAAAEALKSRFPDPDWINVSLVPVESVALHA